jgi:TonB family protein
MFGTLLESRARRNRRTGGAALSVAAHIAIIGAATAATVHGKASPPAPPKPEFLVFHVAPAPKPIEHRASTAAAATASHSSAPAPVVITLTAPTTVPVALPEIDLSHGVTPDNATIVRSVTSATGGGQAGRTLDLTAESPEWSSRELLMHITSSAKPRYPETLRQSGIDGRVLVQFSVDTTGRVDLNSVRVLQSTHDLFTQSVRTALASFRFRPAEVNGKRTAALAEMPFEFQIR